MSTASFLHGLARKPRNASFSTDNMQPPTEIGFSKTQPEQPDSNHDSHMRPGRTHSTAGDINVKCERAVGNDNRQVQSYSYGFTFEQGDSSSLVHDRSMAAMDRQPLRSSLKHRKSQVSQSENGLERPRGSSRCSHGCAHHAVQFTDENGIEQTTDGPTTRFDGFLHTTTFHGINQIFESDSVFPKIFWSVTLVCVFAIVSMQLRNLLVFFIANPTVTSIDVVYPENGLKIPAITLCTLAKLNQTRVKEAYPKVRKELAEFATTSFMSAYSTALMDLGYFNRTSNYSMEELEEQLWEYTGHNDILDFIEDVTFTCENQLLMCWFENGHVFDCCNSNGLMQVKRHLAHSGVCFEFTNNASHQRLPGPVGGFGFMYWFPNDHVYQTAYNSYNEHAVQLFMSAADSMLENNPISLPIGYHSHLNLVATETEKLTVDELGRSACEVSKLKYFDNYSYQACQVECLIDLMLDKCNCTGIHLYAHLPQDRVCTPLDAIDCYTKLAEKFTELLVICRRKLCTEECKYWSYRSSLTVSKVFHPCCVDEMLQYWRTPVGDPFESLIIADVYFGEIKYTKITQNPALTFETFVSSIGGAMGLWTGASIITWIHLIYFCCAACFRRRENKKIRRNMLKEKQLRSLEHAKEDQALNQPLVLTRN